MLSKPPREVPRISSLEDLAPKFRRAVLNILQGMRDKEHSVLVFESLRTAARQEFLYGFGRQYDDGRGMVTKSPTAVHSWHFYGLAVDIVQDDSTPWVAPMNFWQDLGLLAQAHGCKWGGRWARVDLPHIQWGPCRISPSVKEEKIYFSQGREALWKEVGAL